MAESLSTFVDCIGNPASDKANCSSGVIVAWNHIVDVCWIAVAIHHGHRLDAKSLGFCNRNGLFDDVHHKDCVWQFGHGLDATKVVVQLANLCLRLLCLTLGGCAEFAFGNLLFKANQVIDTSLNGLEVCHQPAKPAPVDIHGSTSKSGLADNQLGLLFGANEQDLAPPRRKIRNVFCGRLKVVQGGLRIDDVDFLALLIDVRCHFRMPSLGGVTDVDTSFQESSHCQLLLSYLLWLRSYYGLFCHVVLSSWPRIY